MNARTVVRRISPGFLMIVLLAVGTLGAQTFKSNATAGFTFLEIPVTARTAALGEASLALADAGSAAVFDNAAALVFMQETHSISASYAPWFADIKHSGFSYGLSTGMGVIGVSAVALDYGSFPRTVIGDGQKVYDVVGTFSARSIAVGLTFSRRLTDRFAFGTTLKYAREQIDVYAASNVLFDGGMLYYTGFGSLRIAATIQNFGVNAKFINDQFKMPSVLKMGAAMDLLGGDGSDVTVTLMAEALHPNNASEKVNVGGEVSWRNMLSLRGGYKFFSDVESYSVGLGVDPGLPVPLRLDVATADYGRLGRISRITLNCGIQ